MKNIKEAKTFDELLDIKYGEKGSKEREEFELRAKSFLKGERLKELGKTVRIIQNRNTGNLTK